MNDLPRNSVTRTAKLAALPAGFAGRTALGAGKRLGGRPAEVVAQQIQHGTMGARLRSRSSTRTRAGR